MKDAVIELLEFPRSLLLDMVQLDDCPHAGNYAGVDRACHVCDTRVECEWLHHNDACVDLHAKSIDAAKHALDVAILYVDARVTRAGHPRHACGCEACAWLRKARELSESVEISPP